MASISKAWVATHTGLPSLQVSGPGIVRAGSRVVATLKAGTHLLSDPLAPAGVPTVYTLDASTATLTRARGPRRGAIVTSAFGRGLIVPVFVDNGMDCDWDSGATRYPSGAVRWSAADRPDSEVVRFVVTDLAELDQLRTVVRVKSALIVCTGVPAPGVVPVRHALVRQVSQRRRGVDGAGVFDVSLESLPVPSSGLSAPVVTWGEAAALGWRNLSAVGYAQAIAGMP